jgi:peptidoglycan/xylan/chitin deacetylase (PgdA/CDA1 family)
MIVLNYHRVAEGLDEDFYAVSPATLARHLREIQRQQLGVVGVGEALAARIDGGMVMLNFDDGTEDHFYRVLPLLEELGMKGVFFVSTSKVGKAGYLTDCQVKAMAAAGHDIECHGHSHRRMDRMNPVELDRELAESVALIQEWTDRPPRILAPPGGFISGRVIETGRRHGMDIIRTMRWNTNRLPVSEILDCLVVTRTTPDARIRKWLAGHGMVLLRYSYLAKQGLRALLPFDCYLKVRNHMRGGRS